MRMTLTLDDDVASQLRRRARSNCGGLKGVVNETLRRGLVAGESTSKTSAPFVVRARSCGFLPGVDPLKLNRIMDEMETAKFVARHR